MGLYEYVIENKIPTPIKLEIGLVKTVYDRKRNGRDARYLKVYTQKQDVTQMVAEAVNLKLSHSQDAYDCLIVHGSGMDMGFFLQDRVYRAAYIAGYPGMFDRDDYKYLGKRIRGKALV